MRGGGNRKDWEIKDFREKETDSAGCGRTKGLPRTSWYIYSDVMEWLLSSYSLLCSSILWHTPSLEHRVLGIYWWEELEEMIHDGKLETQAGLQKQLCSDHSLLLPPGMARNQVHLSLHRTLKEIWECVFDSILARIEGARRPSLSPKLHIHCLTSTQFYGDIVSNLKNTFHIIFFIF